MATASSEQKRIVRKSCQQLLQMLNDLGEYFWSRLVTVDETWLPFSLP